MRSRAAGPARGRGSARGPRPARGVRRGGSGASRACTDGSPTPPAGQVGRRGPPGAAPHRPCEGEPSRQVRAASSRCPAPHPRRMLHRREHSTRRLMGHPTDDRSYRLPGTVRPRSYEATLAVDLDAKRFSGKVRIAVELAEAAAEVVLHAADLIVARAAAVVGGEAHAAAIRMAPASETVVLGFARTLPAGPA